MKKYICLILVFVTAVVTVGAACYRLGFNNAEEERDSEIVIADTDISDSICKIDYPLIDVAFNDGNDYDVVIINGIYEQNQKYLLCEEPGELQEHLWVNTYPAGRGTTGESAVIVYKNGEEVKSLECFEIGFGKKDLESKFERISAKEFDGFLERRYEK